MAGLFAVAGIISALAFSIGIVSIFNIFTIDNTRPALIVTSYNDGADAEISQTPFLKVGQEVDGDGINDTISSMTRAQLEQELQKMQNILEPRNISEAFMPGQTYSVNQSENPYAQMKEGQIAGIEPTNRSK